MRPLHATVCLIALAALTLCPPSAAAQRAGARNANSGARATSARSVTAAPVDPRQHLHRGATAFGRFEFDELRSFRHFRALARHAAREADASIRDANRFRSLLERTDTISISTIQGPGRTAELATVLLHGNYLPNEVPNAVLSVLPGVLAGIWEESEIEGKTAYEFGIGALVRLSDSDWLLARRIDGELPVTPQAPPAALEGGDYARLARAAALGQGAASGVLVAPEAPDTALAPPDGLGILYHRTKNAQGHLELGDTATARFSFEMRTEAAAEWREAQLRELLDRIAANVAAEEGGAPLTYELRREGLEVSVALSLTQTQLDAYVARFLSGRLLSEAPAAERSPAPSAR